MARFDLADVKAAATGHWSAIVNRVAGIDDDYLTIRHGRCPRCDGGAGADRWRVFNDFSETGGAICNQCGKFGDGFALIQWYMGIGFPDAIEKVATFLGVQPSKAKSPSKKKGDPARHLEFMEWSDQLVALWCLKKKPITPAAIAAVGGRLARYRKRYTVIAIPAWGEKGPAGKAVGWVLYNVSGGTLPVFKGQEQPVDQVKVKTASGSDAGFVRVLSSAESSVQSRAEVSGNGQAINGHRTERMTLVQAVTTQHEQRERDT